MIWLLAPLLPRQAAAVEVFSDIGDVRLFPAEQAVVARASARRRAEFATGRACARAALAGLGMAAVPILPGPRGEPQWPAGIVGSITHCAGYRACAAARLGDVTVIGIDAEPDRALPHGSLEDVAVPSERGWLTGMTARTPDVSWDRLLFSAKESAYKAWFPLTRVPLRFRDVEVSLCPDEREFTVRVLKPAAVAGGRSVPQLHGNWIASKGLVITAVSNEIRPACTC